MKNKIIGIDLDDTITNIRESMHEEADKFAKSKGLKIIDDTKYLVGEKYGFTESELEEFFKNYRIKIVENAKVRSGAKDVLKKIINLAYEFTKNWLDKNEIPYTKLIVNAKNKKEICKEEKVSIFIDDMPSNCLDVAGLSNIKVYIMDNVDNYLQDNRVKRIYSFLELYDDLIN